MGRLDGIDKGTSSGFLRFTSTASVRSKGACLVYSSRDANVVAIGKIAIGSTTPAPRAVGRIALANGCRGGIVEGNRFFVGGGTFCVTSHRIAMGNCHNAVAMGSTTNVGYLLVSFRSMASVGTVGASGRCGAIRICAMDNVGLHSKDDLRGTLGNLPQNICVIGKRGIIGWPGSTGEYPAEEFRRGAFLSPVYVVNEGIGRGVYQRCS